METLKLGAVNLPLILLENIPKDEWGIMTIFSDGNGEYTAYFNGERVWRGSLETKLEMIEGQFRGRIYVGGNESGGEV